MQYIIGLDIGTSGVKGLLLDGNGQVTASAHREYTFSTPRAGWAEQDPGSWVYGTNGVIRQLLNDAGVQPSRIAGIGMSGQMHSAVFLDKDGAILRSAILWNDGRTKEQCQQITEMVGRKRLLLETGNPALEGFTAPKILWLRQHQPELFRRLRCVLLPKDYVRFRLTGRLCMELSDAAGTLLLNVQDRCWSETILSALDLDASLLPPLVQSSDVCGHLTSEAAAACGLLAGTPVVGGGADNACGAVGAGVVCAGRGLVSLGTSGVMLAHLDEPAVSNGGTIHMFNHAVPNRYYMMGVILSAGLSLRWFRDQFGPDKYPQLMELAAQSSPGSRGLLFLPYLNGERTPHADANARAAFVGLSSAHSKADMVRSVLEGVAFAFCDSLRLLRASGWQGKSMRIIGGGSKSPLWQEIIATATGLTLEQLVDNEGPAMGAALLAGFGTGVYPDLTATVDKVARVIGQVEPRKEWHTTYEELYRIYQGLYARLRPSYEGLATLGSIEKPS